MPMHKTYKYARLLLACLILFSPSAGSANSRDTLAPSSGLDGGTAGKQTTLEMLKATKLKQLLADGHDAFMAQRLVENQVLVAQHSALRLSRAIESYFHLAEFPVSLAYLEKSANFFGISRYELAQMTGIALNPETLYWGARASWTLQTGRMRSDPRIRGLELGEKPTRETLENFIQAQLTFYLAQDLDLAPRAQRWIQDPSKTRQHALDELAFVFEDFLYSERHAQALYDYFKALQDHWDIPTAEIRTAWQSKLTPRQRKIHEHIAQHIAQKDRMTYAEYMDLVLYHPDHGYYMQARDEAFIGGEFDTIPQLTPRLGEAVANDLLIRWNSLGKPKEFDVVEMGAGEGHLARTLLMYVKDKSTSTQARPADPQWQAFAQALRYTIVELSPVLIAKQKKALGTQADSVTWKHGSAVKLGEVFPPDSITGVFLSNELPDAFPVHKVRPLGGKLQEVYVVHRDGILIEESAPPSTPELQAHLDRRNIQLAEGEEWVINLEADRWMQAMAKALKRGSILTLDYGHHSGQNRAIRNNMGQVRSFGRFAYQRLLHYAGIDVARDQARERFQQEMAKSSGKDPFFEARQMLLESINHVLSFAGEVDLTTNVDFEALLYEASRLGFHEESFDSQREYMKLMLVHDPERHARINEAVQQISQIYFVQTLSLLKQRERIAEGLPTGAYDLLLRKKTIDHAGDIHVLFDFLEEYDPAGLGSVARAYRQESQRQRRPLVGISVDCLIFLTEDIFTPLFQKDRGYLQRSTFPHTIPVKTGRTLDDVLKRLIRDLPTHALPPAYQEMGQAIPEITAGMSFLQVFNALKIRGEIERTLEQKAAADFLQALDKIGYPARDYGYTPKELEALTHKKWGNLRKSIVQAEPDRTLVVVEAILKALHVFYERDEQRFTANPQLFLEDPTGLMRAMRIEWPLFIEYIGQHIEAIAPGVDIDALMAGAQAHVNPRLANKVQEVLAGSARTEPTEVRLAILEGFISVLNEKLDPLSPLSKDAAHAIPQMAQMPGLRPDDEFLRDQDERATSANYTSLIQGTIAVNQDTINQHPLIQELFHRVPFRLESMISLALRRGFTIRLSKNHGNVDFASEQPGRVAHAIGHPSGEREMVLSLPALRAAVDNKDLFHRSEIAISLEKAILHELVETRLYPALRDALVKADVAPADARSLARRLAHLAALKAEDPFNDASPRTLFGLVRAVDKGGVEGLEYLTNLIDNTPEAKEQLTAALNVLVGLDISHQEAISEILGVDWEDLGTYGLALADRIDAYATLLVGDRMPLPMKEEPEWTDIPAIASIGKRVQVTVLTKRFLTTDKPKKGLVLLEDPEIISADKLRGNLEEPLNESGATKAEQKLVLDMLELIKNSNVGPNVERVVFRRLLGDRIGAASHDLRLIALQEYFRNNPLVLWHEIMELLVQSGDLNLTASGAWIDVADKDGLLLGRLNVDAKGFRQLKKRYGDPHYILRAMQRHIFRAVDERLSEDIGFIGHVTVRTDVRASEADIEPLIEELLTQDKDIGGLISAVAKERVDRKELSGQIDVTYHAEGSNKRVFRTVLGRRAEAGKEDVQIVLAVKHELGEGTITENEIEDLKWLSSAEHRELGVVPIFGKEFKSRDGRVMFVEEFIEGFTAQELLDQGELDWEKREAIISTLLNAGVMLGNTFPRDIHKENFVIDEKGDAVMVDIGKNRFLVLNVLQSNNYISLLNFLHSIMMRYIPDQGDGDDRILVEGFLQALENVAGVLDRETSIVRGQRTLRKIRGEINDLLNGMVAYVGDLRGSPEKHQAALKKLMGDHYVRVFMRLQKVPFEQRAEKVQGYMERILDVWDIDSVDEAQEKFEDKKRTIGKKAILAGVESDHARVRVPSDGDREHIIPLQSSGPVDLDRLPGEFAEMGLHAADGQRASRLLSLLQKAPRLFIFEKVVEDFLGFANAQEQAIGLHQELATDPIAQFHELGEYLAATGQVQLQFKGNSALLLKKFRLLDRYNKTVPLSGEIIVRDSAGNGIDIIPVSGEALSIALKGHRDPHYLFRAIARQLLGARDIAFTQKIKALTAKPRPAASPKLPAQGQPPAVSPGFSVVGTPSPLETVSPPGHPTAISL